MRKTILLLAALGLFLGLAYVCFVTESRDFANYTCIRVGMSIEEVQAILGPGTTVKQEEVPGFVVAVNPQDAVGSIGRARKVGPIATCRDYPTRIKPVVEGDHILRWVNSETGERILVAFKDGRACEKDFYDPNYL